MNEQELEKLFDEHQHQKDKKRKSYEMKKRKNKSTIQSHHPHSKKRSKMIDRSVDNDDYDDFWNYKY